jgi:hypothetical protein
MLRPYLFGAPYSESGKIAAQPDRTAPHCSLGAGLLSQRVDCAHGSEGGRFRYSRGTGSLPSQTPQRPASLSVGAHHVRLARHFCRNIFHKQLFGSYLAHLGITVSVGFLRRFEPAG